VEIRMTGSTALPVVGIVMGSRSDWDTLKHSEETLQRLGIPCEVRVVSAHRTPDLLFRYAEEAAARGIKAIIAGAGGAAHLPGMLAAKTPLPVLGVPVQSKVLNGVDSLLSIVQMPAGIPVAAPSTPRFLRRPSWRTATPRPHGRWTPSAAPRPNRC
jgi:5-(carboxyamino)imidazole ribonucleotide mutase